MNSSEMTWGVHRAPPRSTALQARTACHSATALHFAPPEGASAVAERGGNDGQEHDRAPIRVEVRRLPPTHRSTP